MGKVISECNIWVRKPVRKKQLGVDGKIIMDI